jgi:hypothetical protein
MQFLITLYDIENEAQKEVIYEGDTWKDAEAHADSLLTEELECWDIVLYAPEKYDS